MRTSSRVFWMALLLTTIPGIGSCSGKKIISESTLRARLFPNGEYRHQVTLTLATKPSEPKRQFSFSGVVQLKDESIRIVALTPFGLTAFKLLEDTRTGEIKTEIYLPGMKRFEPRLLQYYRVLRRLLLVPASPEPEEGLVWVKEDFDHRPVELNVLGGQDPQLEAHFYFDKYDAHRIPEKIRIKSSTFDAEIQVTEYAL